jgi:hypothetical protein
MSAKQHGRQAAVQAASSNIGYQTFFGKGKMALEGTMLNRVCKCPI